MKRNRYITDILYWVAGCGIYSVAVTALLTPNEISPGGFTGIAAAIGSLFGISTGWILLALNIPLLIFALIKLGGGFTLKTVAVTFILSSALNTAEMVFPAYKLNPILAAVFGGMLSGLGLSLILLRGATTGGVDVIAMLVNARRPHITLGRFIMLFDFAVVAFAALVYGNIESALYSVISIYAATRIMDGVLYGGNSGKMLFIITERAAELAIAIGTQLRRGTTAISARGGFTGGEKPMLMCAVRKHEVAGLISIIRDTDPAAFTIVTDAGEIIGQGFRNING